MYLWLPRLPEDLTATDMVGRYLLRAMRPFGTMDPN